MFFIFITRKLLSEHKTFIGINPYVEPTWENLALDPLVVLHLNNLLYIIPVCLFYNSKATLFVH